MLALRLRVSCNLALRRKLSRPNFQSFQALDIRVAIDQPIATFNARATGRTFQLVPFLQSRRHCFVWGMFLDSPFLNFRINHAIKRELRSIRGLFIRF